ncbi:hypothetical protein MMC30_006275 [Trapelia coarctata]|nr:hypothetical protein [Trapelia coarctata]
MTTQLVVPLVTPDDLIVFHTRVYGKPFTGNLPHPENYESSSLVTDDDYAEDDDGLGYYDDGAKRTLTDEQIAMFRHSEIQSILRARRQTREKTISEYRDVPRSKDMGDGVWGVEEAEKAHEGAEEGEVSDEDDEEEYARFLEAERKEMELAASRQKKKGGQGQNARGTISTRRTVREMDAVFSTNDALDYGDEAGDTVATPEVPNSVTTTQDVGGSGGQGSHRTGEGRKIWWPTLQG